MRNEDVLLTRSIEQLVQSHFCGTSFVTRLLVKHYRSLVYLATAMSMSLLMFSCTIVPHLPPITKPILGMWIWHAKYIQEVQEQNRLIKFCLEHGVNRVLVQIHFEPYSAELGDPVLLYPEELRRLIRVAARAGIAVEALDGDQDMALADHHPQSLSKLDAILAFNRTLPVDARFVGMHYDIEPYTLPEWNTPQRLAIMQQYLDFHQIALNRLRAQSPPMMLATSIPFWYDLKTDPDDLCVFEYDGDYKNFHHHIQDIVDYVAIMSYRCQADGEDSISFHVKEEVEYAHQIGRFACAGMETIQLDETPEITFFGLPAKEFWSQKRKLNQIFTGQPGYGGVLIHDYRGFQGLVGDPPIVRAD